MLDDFAAPARHHALRGQSWPASQVSKVKRVLNVAGPSPPPSSSPSSLSPLYLSVSRRASAGEPASVNGIAARISPSKLYKFAVLPDRVLRRSTRVIKPEF